MLSGSQCRLIEGHLVFLPKIMMELPGLKCRLSEGHPVFLLKMIIKLLKKKLNLLGFLKCRLGILSRIETEPTNKEDVMAMDESEPEPRSDQNKMENTITVECQNFNGRLFNGTVNFSEAKVKIFQDDLGLDVGLPEAVKISFKRFLFL